MPSLLATYLAEELDRRGWKQKDLSERSGIPRATMSRIMSGEVQEIRPSQIGQIAEALGVEYWEVLAHVGYSPGRPGDPDEETRRIATILAANPRLQSALDRVMQLSEEDLHAVLFSIELLLQRQAEARRRRQESPRPPEECQ